MGGTIDVLTAPGSGTQIVIRLKFRPADEKDVDSVDRKEAEQLTNNDPAKQEIDFSKKRLLLVEDNEINMEIALMILSQAGFMVDTAENGQIAVDLVSSSVPGYYDAILMDIQMPVMNGFEATRTIRSLPDPSLARIPIIAMTANAFKEDAQATLDAGMEAHIAKPIDVDILMKTLTDVLLASEKK
jgi:CheY-like chemotaxis protein